MCEDLESEEGTLRLAKSNKKLHASLFFYYSTMFLSADDLCTPAQPRPMPSLFLSSTPACPHADHDGEHDFFIHLIYIMDLGFVSMINLKSSSKTWVST
jgi:hypothetical protein